MSEVTIRFATSDDAELIAALSRQTFYETFAGQNTRENMEQFLNENFTREALIKEVEDEENIFLLAYKDNEAAGYVRMRESKTPTELDNAPAIEIARIYAITHLIGTGIGQALMQKCIEIAVTKSKQVIWLGVWEHNRRAIDFYTKWGFEKFGEHTFQLGKDAQTDWLMKMLLAVSKEEE